MRQFWGALTITRAISRSSSRVYSLARAWLARLLRAPVDAHFDAQGGPAATETATATVRQRRSADQTARFPRSSPIPLGISVGNARDFLNTSAGRTCIGGTLGSLLEDSTTNNISWVTITFSRAIIAPLWANLSCSQACRTPNARGPRQRRRQIIEVRPLHFAIIPKHGRCCNRQSVVVPKRQRESSSDILNIAVYPRT